MKVSKFTIKNLFGITEFEATGKSLEITGSNGTGKTSILDAFKYALQNKSDRDYIVRTGENEGEVIIETDSGIRVHRKPRTNKAGYKSIKEAGDKKEKTEGFLRGIFTELQLNPIEFIHFTKDEQNRIVLDLIEFEWDLEWIKKEFGEVVPDVNYEQNILCVLHDIQADEGYYFLTRQDKNRDMRHKTAFVHEIGLKLPGGYNAEEWEKASVGDLYKKVERIRNENQEIEKSKGIVENRDNKARSFQADYEIKISAIDKEIQNEKEMANKRIADLKMQLTSWENKLEGLADVKSTKTEIAKAEYDKNVAQFDGEVKDHIEKSKKETSSFAEYQEEAEHIELMKSHINQYKNMKVYQEEIKTLEEDSDALTRKIEHARTLPGQILETCNIPIEGLTVVDGIPLINGLPISNLSEGEKLDLCIDIATQNDASLDILLIDGVEKLSLDNRIKLYTKLKAKGSQFIATRTTNDKDLTVIEL